MDLHTSPPTTPPTPSPVFAAPSFPELYERTLVGPLFAPWAEQLLGRAPLPAAARVLDVACGTGIVARLALRRLGGRGRVVGVDLSPGMLAAARAIEPAVDFREGSAERLPVADDERFDVAFCQQGMQFFGDRAAAARELRRALVPGGLLAVALWRPAEENGAFGDLGAVAERFLGPVDDVRYSFADGAALSALLRDAGFADVRVEAVTLETRLPVEPALLARMNATALVGMSAAGKSMSEAQRADAVAAITEASLEPLARYEKDGALAFPTSANVATARA